MLTLPLPLLLLFLLQFLYPGEDGKLEDVMDRISAGDTVQEAHLKFMSTSIQIKHKHILLDCNAVFNTRGEFSYARSVKRLCALSRHYRAHFILISILFEFLLHKFFCYIRILIFLQFLIYYDSCLL